MIKSNEFPPNWGDENQNNERRVWWPFDQLTKTRPIRFPLLLPVTDNKNDNNKTTTTTIIATAWMQEQ